MAAAWAGARQPSGWMVKGVSSSQGLLEALLGSRPVAASDMLVTPHSGTGSGKVKPRSVYTALRSLKEESPDVGIL